MPRFYLTTAIDYANGDPHIGHAYEKIGADAIARYHRLRGDDVHFLIGMDEHGQKVAQTAAERGITPQAQVDEIAERFQAMWRRLAISNDQFIRTTSAHHVKGVQALIERIFDAPEARSLVVLLPPDLPAEKEVVDAVADLAKRGVTVVLDEFELPKTPGAPILSFLAHAKAVRIDLRCQDPAKLGPMVAARRPKWRVEESPSSKGRLPGNAWAPRGDGQGNRKDTARFSGKGEMVG